MAYDSFYFEMQVVGTFHFVFTPPNIEQSVVKITWFEPIST